MKSSHLLFICLAVLLLITPGSAQYWCTDDLTQTWCDHYDRDSSSDYWNPISTWTWDTGNSLLWDNGQWDWLEYDDEQFGAGNYTWTIKGTGYPFQFAFASQTYHGDLSNIHYFIGFDEYPAQNKIDLYRYEGGWHFITDWAFVPGDESQWHTLTVNWTPNEATTMLVYWDGTYIGSTSNNAINTPGYLGFWTYTLPNSHAIHKVTFNNMTNWTPGAEPTPTPTPTPSFTFPPAPQDGLYIGGEQVQPGILSGIFLVLDQNVFLLIAVLILGYLVIRG